MNEPRYKLLWQTVAIFASMLIFASLRPSTADVTASDITRSTMLDSSPQGLRRTVSGTRSQQMGVSKTAEVQMRQSDYFVARKILRPISISTGKVLRPCRNLGSRALGRGASVTNVQLGHPSPPYNAPRTLSACLR